MVDAQAGARCEYPGCTARIYRSLDQLCGEMPDAKYGCGGYFCAAHLYLAPERDAQHAGYRCRGCSYLSDEIWTAVVDCLRGDRITGWDLPCGVILCSVDSERLWREEMLRRAKAGSLMAIAHLTGAPLDLLYAEALELGLIAPLVPVDGAEDSQ